MEAVPGARRIAALADSNATPTQHIRALQDAARSRGVEVSVFGVARPEDIATAIDAAKGAGAEALNFLASALFFPVSRIVIEHTKTSKLPAIHHWPETAEAGGVLAYGPRWTQVWRQRARLTARFSAATSPRIFP